VRDYTTLPMMLTLKQVEEYYGLSQSTMRKWLMVEGKFTPAHKIGSKWFVNKDELEQWLKTDLSHMTVSA